MSLRNKHEEIKQVINDNEKNISGLIRKMDKNVGYGMGLYFAEDYSAKTPDEKKLKDSAELFVKNLENQMDLCNSIPAKEIDVFPKNYEISDNPKNLSANFYRGCTEGFIQGIVMLRGISLSVATERIQPSEKGL